MNRDQEKLTHRWTALLLSDPSACLRWLVLRELLERPAEDAEICELAELRETDPLAADVLAQQEADGGWPGTAFGLQGDRLRATTQAMNRLGYLGLGSEQPAVQRGAAYLFAHQREDGAWPMPSAWADNDGGQVYTMVPLQTALPLRGLAACGYSCDPRAERAYDWLLAQRLPDGAWPTGLASGNYGGVGGYRRLAHSRWGCRSNTTGALCCLALHPQRRHSPEASRALDLLLGRETREEYSLGFEVARLIGTEATSGFLTHYARFDWGQVLDLCWHIGASCHDPRVAEAATFVRAQQGRYGIWDYARRPQASRWVTFDLLRSLTRLSDGYDWVSLEARTPFQPYIRPSRRY